MSIEVNKQRLVRILFDYENQVKRGKEIMAFVDRIVADDEPDPDPGSFYLCCMCGDLTKGINGKFLHCGPFVCYRCNGQEVNFEIQPKEGE